MQTTQGTIATNKMVDKKTWKEFKDSGLLFITNQFLHIFGWSIVFDYSQHKGEGTYGQPDNVFIARVKFRGFSEKTTDKGYLAISQYMKDNSQDLWDEVNE